MKNLIIYSIFALLVFLGSASVLWWLQDMAILRWYPGAAP